MIPWAAKMFNCENAVDVIIPVLNGAKTIEAAIDTALNQYNVNISVIVVDAGSTDGTIEIVNAIHDPRIQLISGMGKLMTGAARNVGIEASHSSWISFLDADDLWPYGRVQQMLEGIADPTCQIAIGHMITFPDGAEIDPSQLWPLENSHLAPIAGGVLLSRTLFKEVGQFDFQFRVGEFIDWMARARIMGIQEVPIGSVVLLRRNHAHNTTKTRKEDYASTVLSIALKHRSRQGKPLAE